MTFTNRQGNMMKRTSTLTLAVLLLMVLTIPVFASGSHHDYCEKKPWKCATTTTTVPETTTTIVEETTTTTVPTTTTIPAETTTTVVEQTTTTGVQPGTVEDLPTVLIPAVTITTAATPATLPFTGADTPSLLLIGLALFGLGGLLVRSARRDGV